MCNIGAIGLGIQVGGLLANTMSSIQEAKAYSNYSIASTNAALANYGQQVNSVSSRYAQEVESAHQEQKQVYLQNLKAKATAQASAATRGVEGTSIDSLFAGYDRQSAISNYLTERDLRNIGLQYDDQLEGLRIGAINSINSQTQYTNRTGSTILSGIGGIFQSATKSGVLNRYLK